MVGPRGYGRPPLVGISEEREAMMVILLMVLVGKGILTLSLFSLIGAQLGRCPPRFGPGWPPNDPLNADRGSTPPSRGLTQMLARKLPGHFVSSIRGP